MKEKKKWGGKNGIQSPCVKICTIQLQNSWHAQFCCMEILLLIVIGRTKKKKERKKERKRKKRRKRRRRGGEKKKFIAREKTQESDCVVRQKLAKRRFDLPVTPEGSLIPNYFVGTGRLRRSIWEGSLGVSRPSLRRWKSPVFNELTNGALGFITFWRVHDDNVISVTNGYRVNVVLEALFRQDNYGING